MKSLFNFILSEYFSNKYEPYIGIPLDDNEELITYDIIVIDFLNVLIKNNVNIIYNFKWFSDHSLSLPLASIIPSITSTLSSNVLMRDIDNFNSLFTDTRIDYYGMITFDSEEAEIAFRLKYL